VRRPGVEPDAVTVDALARLQLARRGRFTSAAQRVAACSSSSPSSASPTSARLGRRVELERRPDQRNTFTRVEEEGSYSADRAFSISRTCSAHG
jgi:hypothetical protein